MILATLSNDTIQAIASLWKLVAAFAFLLAVVILRKPLQHVVMKARKFSFRKGEAEVSVDTGTDEGSSKSPPPDEKKQEPAEPPTQEEPTPEKPGSLFYQMYAAFTDGKFDEADKAFETLQKAEEDPSSRLRNEAVHHWLMYRHGRDSKAIQKLEKLAENADARETALFWIANCHEHSGSYAKAEDAYRRALSGKLSDSDRARHVVGLAKCRVAIGKTQEGLDVLAAALDKVKEAEAKAAIFRSIADIHEKQGNSTLRAVALQKVLEFAPEDTSALFSAAYSQSEAKLSCLCVANYRTLLRFDPNHYSGLNNLGVECDTLELPIKSVSYYQRAVERDNTLAMSNLAYRYMNQGFDAHAQELLDKARKNDDPHRNVGEAMSALVDKKQKESDAWEKVAAEGLKQKEFFWAYADAYYTPPTLDRPFAGRWVAPGGKVFSVSQHAERVEGQWETEKEGEKFSGTVHSFAAAVNYQRKGTSLGLAFGPMWGSSQDGFAYVSPDSSRLFIHTCEKSQTLFLELKREQEQHPTTESNATSG